MCHYHYFDTVQSERCITLEVNRLCGRCAGDCEALQLGAEWPIQPYIRRPARAVRVQVPSGHQTSELLRAGWRVNWFGVVNESWPGTLYDEHAELAARDTSRFGAEPIARSQPIRAHRVDRPGRVFPGQLSSLWRRRPMGISGWAANSVCFASMAFTQSPGNHLRVSISLQAP